MKYLLLLDYDGTLTKIVSRPELAKLSNSRRAFLKRLARQKNLKLAIVSGRSLKDVKSLVRIPGIIYVGNHGFEILSGKKKTIFSAAKKSYPMIRRCYRDLKKSIKMKGFILEDKGLTLSAHYRLVPEKKVVQLKKTFKQLGRNWGKRVKITKGKKVFEVRPPVKWDKGRAVRWIIRELNFSGYRPVYIGDDRTDEDAFRVLKETYKVGLQGKTRARYRLRDVNAVYRLLNRIAHGII